MAVLVQKFTVGLAVLVRGDAEARPVFIKLAILFIEIPEKRFDNLCLRIVRPGGCVLRSHDLIYRGEVAPPVVVALQLIDTVSLSEKFGGVVRSIAEGGFNEFGGLTLADRIPDRVIETGVENDYNRETVRVGCNRAPVAGLRLLIEQLRRPAVRRPIQERQCRAGTFHLHALLVAEPGFPETAARYQQIVFFPTCTDGTYGYFLPAEMLTDAVVQHGYLLVVEITRV